MKTLITTAILVVALASGAQANFNAEAARTGSSITPHGIFDGR